MKRKLRILMIAPQFRPIVGGYERAAERLSAELVRLGHEVTVVAERRDRSWPAREQRDGVKVRRLWCLFRPHLHLITSLPTFALFLFTQGWRFHIWHIHQYGTHAVLAVVLGRLLHRPVVLKLTNTGSQGILRTGSALPMAHVAISVLRQVDAAVALSREMEAEAITFGIPSSRVHVLGNGVDMHTFTCRNEDERAALRREFSINAAGIVLFVGRLAGEKNPDGLLIAWKQAFPHFPAGWKLVLVGDGPMRKQLTAFVEAEGLSTSVAFVGFQNNVEAWMAIADIFVVPSHWEGLSNTMLEAMACAIPVVSTRVSGSVEILEEPGAGVVVDVGHREQLAEALSRLAANPTLRSRMGRVGRNLIESTYSIARIAVLHERLYGELLIEKTSASRIA